MGLRVFRAHKERRVLMVERALKVFRVKLAHRELRVCRERIRAQLVCRERRVCVVSKVTLGCRVRLLLLA
jgi:hypothetical protein